MTRRAMNGVLAGFLGTYTSRYSNYDGFWLFGFLVADLGTLVIDLLGVEPDLQTGLVSAATSIARERFADQLAKAGVSLAMVGEAKLEITRGPAVTGGWVNGTRSDGYDVVFTVEVLVDTGRRFHRQQSLFVAPHSELDLRSARGT